MVKRTFYFVDFRLLHKERPAIRYTELCYDLPKSTESLIVDNYLEIEFDDTKVHLFKTLVENFYSG